MSSENEESLSLKGVLHLFMNENKRYVNTYILLSFIVSGIDIALAYLYGKISAVINEAKGIDGEAKKYLAFIVIAMALRQITRSCMLAMDTRFRPRLRQYLRKYIVERVMNMYSENYREEELGGLLSGIVELPSEIDHLFIKVRTHTIPIVSTMILSIGYFFYVNPVLGSIGLMSVGLYVGLALLISKRSVKMTEEMSSREYELHDEISDCFTNIFNIHTTNKKKDEMERLKGFDERFKESHQRRLTGTNTLKTVLSVFNIVLFLVINMYSFYLFSQGKIGLNDVITVIIVTSELVWKLSLLVNSVDKITYQMTYINQIEGKLKELEKKAKMVVTKVGKNLKGLLNGDIELKGVGLKYGNKKVLNDINLTIPAGLVTALVGEIGSGKSSIVNSLLRMTPYTGTITIGGVDIKDIDLNHLRSSIVYIPQNPRLFNRSVYENIAYGNGASKEEVMRVLGRYGLNVLRDKIDDSVGKMGSNLSGGQRQIVCMLRCLFRNASIVILDEPTSSLDEDTKKYVRSILEDVLRDRTVIMITHDSSMLKHSNRIVELHQGNVVTST